MPPSGHMDQSFSMVSPPYGGAHAASMQLAMNTSFDSTQMQTPPPTRGTSAKKPQQGQQIAFGTPSTIASRRFMTPQQPVVPSNHMTPTQHTPMQFPQLQFSPDMYQFSNLGPASAPVSSQSRMMWAQTSPAQPVPQATLDDPFAPAMSPNVSWPGQGLQHSNAQTVSFDTPAMSGFPVQAPHPRPASAVPLSATFANPSMYETTSAGVDPSLLYTSPIRPVVRSNSRSKKARSQVQAAENQCKDSNALAHRRSDTDSSADTTSSLAGTHLQRSNTTGNARPKSAHFAPGTVESLSRRNSVNPIARTDSPVKRFGRSSLGSISESKPRQRTSVILTVDENGIARTETRRLDSSPTRSIRERYPALFDSDSSDPESEISDQTPSRPPSFMFDKRDERRSKAARLDPPVENLEGLSIPRSGSSASMKKGVAPSRAAVAAAAQLRRQGSLRRSTSGRNSMGRRNPITSSTTSIDSCPMDVTASQQPAVSGAEQSSFFSAQSQDGNMNWAAPADDFIAPPSSAESDLEAHNRRWSLMSFEQQQFQTASFSNPSMQTQQHPWQGRLLVRCLCGDTSDRSQRLIQCQSCTQWLHAPCIGLEDQAVPPNFTCFLCTRPPASAPRRKSGMSTR